MTDLHVVALSGGKDSSAMALRLHESHPEIPYVYICTPTGDELPEMFAHWRKLSEILGRQITPIMHAGGLRGLVDSENAIPNWRMRFCTRILKIEPYAAWLLQQTALHNRIVSYVGLRIDEPDREGGDYAHVPGVEFCFPLREWNWAESDVWTYLAAREVTIPRRTDCARCFFQRLHEWHALWRDHRDIFEDASMQEMELGSTWRSPGRDTWPAALSDLALEFSKGRVPKERRDPLAELKCRVCRI